MQWPEGSAGWGEEVGRVGAVGRWACPISSHNRESASWSEHIAPLLWNLHCTTPDPQNHETLVASLLCLCNYALPQTQLRSIQAWSCLVKCAISHRWYLPRPAVVYFFSNQCTFLVYQHWQISGMLRASVADILAVFLSYFPLLYLLWNTADNVSCHWTQEVEPIFEVFYLIDRRSVFVVQIIVSALKVQPITKTSLYQFF